MADENVQETQESTGRRNPFLTYDENGNPVMGTHKWTLRDKWRLHKKLRELEKLSEAIEKQRVETHAMFDEMLKNIEDLPIAEESAKYSMMKLGYNEEVGEGMSQLVAEYRKEYNRLNLKEQGIGFHDYWIEKFTEQLGLNVEDVKAELKKQDELQQAQKQAQKESLPEEPTEDSVEH